MPFPNISVRALVMSSYVYVARGYLSAILVLFGVVNAGKRKGVGEKSRAEIIHFNLAGVSAPTATT
jgi:hypothetical protein